MRHMLLQQRTHYDSAETHFGEAIKKFLAAAIGLHAVVLVIAPDGVAGTLVSAQNQATGARCIGLTGVGQGINNLCTLIPASFSPSGFKTTEVNVGGETLNDAVNNSATAHSFGNPLPAGSVVGDLIQFSTFFGSRSEGSNSFFANGSYQTQFHIEGFKNPMIEFHFQPGEVAFSNTTNAGFEFASLNIHLESTTDPDPNTQHGTPIMGFPKGIQVSDLDPLKPVLDDSAVSFLNASPSGCMPNGTSCSFTFDSLPTGAVPLGGNGFFLFALNTSAQGTVIRGATIGGDGMAVARSGDPNGPPGEFGFTIFEGPVQMPEPSSMMILLVGLTALTFPLLKLKRT